MEKPTVNLIFTSSHKQKPFQCDTVLSNQILSYYCIIYIFGEKPGNNRTLKSVAKQKEKRFLFKTHQVLRKNF